MSRARQDAERRAALDARFMAGVQAGADFMRRAKLACDDGTGFAEAQYRDGRPQAKLIVDLLATLAARPELLDGLDAVLTDVLARAADEFGPPDSFVRMRAAAFTGRRDPLAGLFEPEGRVRTDGAPGRA